MGFAPSFQVSMQHIVWRLRNILRKRGGKDEFIAERAFGITCAPSKFAIRLGAGCRRRLFQRLFGYEKINAAQYCH